MMDNEDNTKSLPDSPETPQVNSEEYPKESKFPKVEHKGESETATTMVEQKKSVVTEAATPEKSASASSSTFEQQENKPIESEEPKPTSFAPPPRQSLVQELLRQRPRRRVSPSLDSCSSSSLSTESNDPHNLISRFATNQRSMFDGALREIQCGAKRSCWLWFVLPTAPHIVDGQERGSSMNQYFALRGDDAVRAYLQLEVTVQGGCVNLRHNYIQMLHAVQEQLEQNNTMLRLFGPADINKATSSFQLFHRIAQQMKDSELVMLSQNVLNLVALDKKKREARSSSSNRKEYRHIMTL